MRQKASRDSNELEQMKTKINPSNTTNMNTYQLRDKTTDECAPEGRPQGEIPGNIALANFALDDLDKALSEHFDCIMTVTNKVQRKDAPPETPDEKSATQIGNALQHIYKRIQFMTERLQTTTAMIEL